MQKGRFPTDAPLQTENRSVSDQACGAASALTREVRRDILREAVFLCRTPLVTPRISSGWAAANAVAAASALPDVRASSTLRRKVRIRERRALLTS